MNAMPDQPKKSYILGAYSLDGYSQSLTREGQRIHLPKRPFQVLLYLIEHRDRVVSRSDLLDLFWEGKDVYDDSLRKCVGTVRKALSDPSSQPRFIETRYAGGYRFIGPVEELAARPMMVETVKTRAVTIVVEEEIHDDSAAVLNHPFKPWSVETQATTEHLQTRGSVQRPARRFNFQSPRSRLFRSTVIMILVAVALGTAAMNIRRSRSSLVSAADQAVTSRSIAVLPLRNLTGDISDEYLSDGLTDSLINELARINNLKVISRSSSFTFKGQETDARDVGRRLGVANILEGSIRKSGERIRINLRLVSTTDGRVIWTGEGFDRALTDIFTMQDEISCSVAESLRVVLCGAQAHKRYTENVLAYQAYLKGRYYWNKRTADGITKSIEYYKEAIKLDPNYALAYAGMADSYVQGVWHVPFAPEEVVPKAKSAVLQAIALDDSLAEAHTALAGVYSMEWNWDATGRELQRALELDPQYARAYHVQAFHLMLTGHYDDAIASIKRAYELDPLNLVVNADVGSILFGVGRTDEALQQWQKALELDPDFLMTHQHRYEAYVVKGDEPAAIAEYFKVLELTAQPPEKIAAYRLAAAQGLRGIWQKDLSDYLAARKRGVYVAPIKLAWLYAHLDQKDQALAQLEQVYRARSAVIALAVSPMFEPLRSEPRFADLIRRTGLSYTGQLPG